MTCLGLGDSKLIEEREKEEIGDIYEAHLVINVVPIINSGWGGRG